MTDIFVDGIRTIAVAHGVARIELVQLKRVADGSNLEPQAAATLLLPVSALKEFTAQLANAVKAIEANVKAKKPRRGEGPDEVQTALENL